MLAYTAILTTLRFQTLYFYAAKTPVFVEPATVQMFSAMKPPFIAFLEPFPVPPFPSLHQSIPLFTSCLGGDARSHIVYWPSFHSARAHLARGVNVSLRVHQKGNNQAIKTYTLSAKGFLSRKGGKTYPRLQRK